MPTCYCFFNALGCYHESEFYDLDKQMIQTAYKKASPLCHLDKNPLEKDTATEAQQIINQARITLSDGP